MLHAHDLPADRIGFRPFAPDDLPMAAAWLRVPEVALWWRDADEQLALLTADLDDPRMTQEIVTLDAAPFAYVQHYECHAWPDAAEFAHMPQGARAIDGFIGRADLIGRGLGSAFLRILGDRLLADGAPALVIDPDPSNERAVRAYRRAGFAGDRILPGWDGDPVLILERWPETRAED